nr:hypothetical protein [Tanacetum cinerariifolium]
MEDQPLPIDASPTALLPGYINDSNPEEDEEDPEKDPVDYPTNGRDNDDNESSDDDDDDDDDVEKDGKVKEKSDVLKLENTYKKMENDKTNENQPSPKARRGYLYPLWGPAKALRSPEYVPDPIELEDYIPTHIPEVASALTPPLPPSFLSPRIRPPHARAAMAQMRAVVPSTYHSLLPSGTPPLLLIPLPVPSTSRRAEILEADTPPRKRLLLTAPRPGCEVGESSAAAARQPGPTMARNVDCSFVNTMETRFRDTERRMITALEMVNMRVSYQVDVRSRESSKFYSRHHEAQKDHAAVRAEIEVLRRERLAYEQESIQTREALARSEAYSRTLEVRVAVLETQAHHHEWRRQTADDFAVQHIMRTQALEAGARIDTLEDTDQERTNTTLVTNAQLQAMIDQGVTTALAARDALRSTNGDDSHNSGTSVRRTERATRECTYTDFLKCQPLHFKGTEGVASLSQWFERMESVFYISNCAAENQVKFATCTLHSIALTWWNTHVKGTGLTSYTQRFQELALLCGRMFPEESDKIERYIGGLPDMIHESVVASKPKTMQEAIEMATELIDKKIRTFAERQTENKRKQDDNNNQAQQQPLKKQGVAIAYTIRPGERKEYAGTLPLCNKCKFHHNGQCTVKCVNCKRVGHLTRYCRSPTATNNHKNLTCYECRNQGHYRIDCPELKNQDHGNQAGGTRAHRMVHALGGGETNQDLNDVEDDINA